MFMSCSIRTHKERTPRSQSRTFFTTSNSTFHFTEKSLRDIWKEHGQLWSDPLNEWATGKLGEQAFWNKRGYDFNVDRRATLFEKLDYCHKNPITRELVERPEDWPWSSYRYYEMDNRSVINMNWNGDWPIIW
jgi:hypothetical protein